MLIIAMSLSGVAASALSALYLSSGLVTCWDLTSCGFSFLLADSGLRIKNTSDSICVPLLTVHITQGTFLASFKT